MRLREASGRQGVGAGQRRGEGGWGCPREALPRLPWLWGGGAACCGGRPGHWWLVRAGGVAARLEGAAGSAKLVSSSSRG